MITYDSRSGASTDHTSKAVSCRLSRRETVLCMVVLLLLLAIFVIDPQAFDDALRSLARVMEPPPGCTVLCPSLIGGAI